MKLNQKETQENQENLAPAALEFKSKFFNTFKRLMKGSHIHQFQANAYKYQDYYQQLLNKNKYPDQQNLNFDQDMFKQDISE